MQYQSQVKLARCTDEESSITLIFNIFPFIVKDYYFSISARRKMKVRVVIMWLKKNESHWRRHENNRNSVDLFIQLSFN